VASDDVEREIDAFVDNIPSVVGLDELRRLLVEFFEKNTDRLVKYKISTGGL
jgi:hypothetical protein